MDEKVQPTSVEIVKKMVQSLKEQGHRHEAIPGRIEVIGDKECWTCKPVLELADLLQQEALYRTNFNRLNPTIQPCEICGKDHNNYECCDKCNYNSHVCALCGDSLGHSEVSACYLLNVDITDAD